MNNKRIFSILLAALTLLSLGSCGKHTSHTHAGYWEMDGNTHWHLCTDCEEKFDSEEHTLQDEYLCTICNAEIWKFDDGSCSIYAMNDMGQTIRSISYEADGSISYDFRYEFQYDENGNVVSEIIYNGSALDSENTYAVNADGDTYTVYSKSYDPDGSIYIHEYDDFGDLTHAEFYDPAGNKTNEEFYEYALDDDACRYNSKITYYDYENGKIYTSEYNSHDDQIGRTISDLNGNIELVNRFERGYDENGKVIWRKDYTNDVLVEEVLNYKTVVTADYSMTFPETIIEYHEDGTKTKTVCDDFGEPAEITDINADGTTERIVIYTHDVDADDIIYVTSKTEYNGNGELVLKELYDAEGNVIG